jgi:hypothetical protein
MGEMASMPPLDDDELALMEEEEAAAAAAAAAAAGAVVFESSAAEEEELVLDDDMIEAGVPEVRKSGTLAGSLHDHTCVQRAGMADVVGIVGKEATMSSFIIVWMKIGLLGVGKVVCSQDVSLHQVS